MRWPPELPFVGLVLGVSSPLDYEEGVTIEARRGDRILPGIDDSELSELIANSLE